ncbi:MAG: type 4a pilus biogenesis protein PilO [Azonexus sp.]|nr:type 4a pilus biogenesis protein PilO [Azonexus sp.]MCK6412017.1 type 4a pilus biogenesis protein PilO [Azonexus sp.]
MALKFSVPKIDAQALLDEFRYMNPNDPGSWPLLPRIAVLLGLFVALLFLGWLLVWDEQLSTLDTRRNEEQSLKEQFLEKKRQAVNLGLYKQQLAEIDRSFGALLKQLPGKAEIEALLIEVNQAGLGRGLQFDLFKPGQVQVRDFYAEMPIVVRVNGSYHDLGAFAADIARLPRIVTLNNIAIAPQKESSGLVLDATIKTFRYLDEEELVEQRRVEAARKKEKAGGKK